MSCANKTRLTKSLNGANVHLGFGFRGYVAETLQAKNIRESLDAHDFGRPKFRLGLLPEGVAVDDETNAPEALGGEQAIEQRDREFGLAGAGRHGEQHLATIGFKSLFDFLNSAVLIGTQRKAEVERHDFQSRVRGVPVDIKLCLQPFGGWPVDQGAPLIGGFARVAKPDAAFGFDLFEIGPAIGRVEKRNPESVPRTASGLSSLKGKATRIALRLINRGRNILALALRLNHANTGQPDKQGVVGWPAFGRPFGEGHGAAFGRARAGSIGELLGIRLPAAISKLLVDDLPRRGFVEVDLLSGGFALLDDLLEIDGCSLGEALRSVEACAESLSFLLSLGGELFPCRAFLGFLAGALLGGLPGAGVFLGREFEPAPPLIWSRASRL